MNPERRRERRTVLPENMQLHTAQLPIFHRPIPKTGKYRHRPVTRWLDARPALTCSSACSRSARREIGTFGIRRGPPHSTAQKNSLGDLAALRTMHWRSFEGRGVISLIPPCRWSAWPDVECREVRQCAASCRTSAVVGSGRRECSSCKHQQCQHRCGESRTGFTSTVHLL
jgi:hypothetical protein